MKQTLITIAALFFVCATAWANGYSVYDLRCEGQTDTPIGVDNQKLRFSWKVNGTERGTRQKAYQIIVAETKEALDGGYIWNSGKTEANATYNIEYRGAALRYSTAYYWKVRSWNSKGDCSQWSEPRKFVTQISNDWGRAKWIALEEDGQKIVPAIHFTDVKKRLSDDDKPGMYKLPQFRKVVKTRKNVVQATAFVAGLGLFDFFIDGQKVGNHFLDAGWCMFNKRAQYVGFDVTSQLAKGSHVLGIMLGNGFYNIPRERYFKMLQSYGAPKMRLCIVVRYDDGTEERIVSDKNWRTTESPITYSSIYGGESYDATCEQNDWMTDIRFNDKLWSKAKEVKQDIVLTAQIGTAIGFQQEIVPQSKFKNSKGQWVYDLGQNFSGIVKIKVNGKRGETIRLVPAELLKSDKTANQRATGSPYCLEYTLRGDSDEQWQPQFSYYGFRYVQVEGCVPKGEDNPDQQPELTELTGLHTTSGLQSVGSFECSKPLFNKTFELIDWAMRSNMSGVLTDCPHREKLGWLEQYYLMQNSMMYRYDVQSIYAKTLYDMADSQLPNGAIPTIAPEYVRFNGGFEDTPEWGSAFIISPWYIYKRYGDKQLIEKHFSAMQKYMDYLASRADGFIISYGLGDWFDIGPQKPGKAQLTSNSLTATATYYYDAMVMAKMAMLIGKDSIAKQYTSLASDIRKAYNARFFNASTHSYENGSQTANAISLYVGMVDDSEEQAVLDNLVADIKQRGNALTAGDIGYRYVLNVLRKYGRSDVIYDMNSRYDVPGYGWQLTHGATALTESWQAYESVSNNHYMLGHIMEWLFSGLGGISQSDESVAFSDIVIDPQIVGDVHHARTSYESVNGRISCEWNVFNGKYSLRLEIPSNTTATVVLPTTNVSNITDFGLPITQSEGITLKNIDKEKSTWSIGSGTYFFEICNPSSK